MDIGTNSIKLLVAEVGPDGVVMPIWETSTQTRLGQGLFGSGRLGAEAIQRTVAAVVRLAESARARGAERLLAVATSAAREAANCGEFLAAVQEAAGLEVRVLTGEEEAEWTFAGVTSESNLRGGRLLVVDVGGGSTEFVLGGVRACDFRCSAGLGTVRLLETLQVSDPPRPDDWERCRGTVEQTLQSSVLAELERALQARPAEPVRWVAAGGTATVLARLERGVDSYDRAPLEGTVLSADALRRWRERLWSLPLAERRNLKGMPADRADVMLTGVGIYERVLERLGLESLRISLRGLRYGVVSRAGAR
jgi:exopolyphosphatase/guanosine-5'-triphosphate,3'-diphosphate pyrophosphatase